MSDCTTPPRFPTIRVNLLHAHGSPTNHLYVRPHQCRCVACRAAKADTARRDRVANPEGEAERHSRYRKAHYEEEIARGRRYYKTHRSQQTQYRRRYYETHQEQCADYTHRWHVAHREERAVSNRAYYLEHIEQQTAYARHYSKTHPGWSASRSRIKRARKLGAGGVHTAADVLAQYERQHARCFYCNVKLGSYHVDHVMPLKLGGSNGSENLVVACPSCNLSKGATHPMDFSGRML